MQQISIKFEPKYKQWKFLSTNTQLFAPASLCTLFGPLIYSCFWEWNNGYVGIASTMSLKFRNNHRLSYMGFLEVSTISALCCGRNAGPTAWTSKMETIINKKASVKDLLLIQSGKYWICPLILRTNTNNLPVHYTHIILKISNHKECNRGYIMAKVFNYKYESVNWKHPLDR